MNRISLLSVVVAMALLIGGCASSGQSSGQIDTSRDVSEMKERILELQEQAAVTQVELDRLRAQVTTLEKMVVGEAVAVVAASAPTAEPMSSEPPTAAMGSASEPAIEESDLEPVAAVATGAVATTGLESDPVASQDRSALQPVEPAAQALYDRGYTLYHQGKYLDAEASFQRFLQAYPNTELSDNAQFWIGESRYARGDIRGSLAAFREVLQKYPQGNKVPDSLIKEGDCLENLGDRDGARDRYNEVMQRFPDSGAAIMAEDRLADLDG